VSTQDASGETLQIGLEWLVRLRWWAGAAEVAAVLLASVAIGVSLPVAPLLALAATTLLSNLALSGWMRRGQRPATSGALGGFLVLDLCLLTGMLALSGGPSNPFSVLSLVYVALAAVLLSPRWAWGTAFLAVASFSLLFLLPASDSGHYHHHGMGERSQFSAHLWGMLAAFAIAAALLAYFVTRVAQALRAREAELAVVRERAARSERLASVMVLAADAAHELGTPLGTIALAAKELERKATRRPGGGPLVEDARLIRSEVGRCRSILDELSVRAGEPAGEAPAPVAMEALAKDVQAALARDLGMRLCVRIDPDVSGVVVPRRAFVQVLANLVRNAFDASPGGALVELVARRRGSRIWVEVRDRGRGMTAQELARATEPFFTTKEPGKNLGLGLFLVDRFAQQIGGRLVLESRPGAGTTAVLEIPA
jgi:two-component system sensor histidine kinase RegB